MPVRPRRRRVGGPEWSPRVALALTIGPRPGDPISDEVLRAQWERWGAYLRATQPPGSEPWGWHRFEGKGAERPKLCPLGPED